MDRFLVHDLLGTDVQGFQLLFGRQRRRNSFRPDRLTQVGLKSIAIGCGRRSPAVFGQRFPGKNQPGFDWFPWDDRLMNFGSRALRRTRNDRDVGGRVSLG